MGLRPNRQFSSGAALLLIATFLASVEVDAATPENGRNWPRIGMWSVYREPRFSGPAVCDLVTKTRIVGPRADFALTIRLDRTGNKLLLYAHGGKPLESAKQLDLYVDDRLLGSAPIERLGNDQPGEQSIVADLPSGLIARDMLPAMETGATLRLIFDERTAFAMPLERFSVVQEQLKQCTAEVGG